MFVPYTPTDITVVSEFWDVLANNFVLAGLITCKTLFSKVNIRLTDY